MCPAAGSTLPGGLGAAASVPGGEASTSASVPGGEASTCASVPGGEARTAASGPGREVVINLGDVCEKVYHNLLTISVSLNFFFQNKKFN